MKGVVFRGDRELELQQFDDPVPGPDEVVVEIKASGLCGSDLRMYRAPAGSSAMGDTLGSAGKPVIAGHEPSGVVVATGSHVDARRARIGQRVMVHHYRGCGACPYCGTGWTQMCAEGVKEVYGITGHGAHAPYMKCLASTLVALPDELSFEAGAAVSCGTGTAWWALQRLELNGGHTVAVFGQGPVGLSATLLASAMGACVIALDISDERLERARAFGATHLINPARVDAVQAIKELTHGRGADASVEASSATQARTQAVQCVRNWGKCCLVGAGGTMTVNVSPDLILRQVALFGSWTFSTFAQAECAQFIADRKLDVEGLFTHRWQLESAAEAYRVFDAQAAGKAVFVNA